MVEIAKRYNGDLQDVYLNAVAQFRIPYWDYFRPRGGAVKFPGVVDKGETSFPYDYSLPRIFTEKSVSVRLYPDDKLTSLGRNPFNYYGFNDKASSKIEWDVFARNVGVGSFLRRGSTLIQLSARVFPSRSNQSVHHTW